MTPSTLSLLLTAVLMLSGCGKAPVDAANVLSHSVHCTQEEMDHDAGPCIQKAIERALGKPDKAAAPEALITIGMATAAPLLVLATSSTEPIPACHHCPLPPPKIEKHRRHKKRWPNDAAQMPLIVPIDPQQRPDAGDPNEYHFTDAPPSQLINSRPMKWIRHHAGSSAWCMPDSEGNSICDSGSEDIDVSPDGLIWFHVAGNWHADSANNESKPMTPQQFTNFMDDNFPSNAAQMPLVVQQRHPNASTESTSHLSCVYTLGQPATYDGRFELDCSVTPTYPPDYKMPKGDQP